MLVRDLNDDDLGGGADTRKDPVTVVMGGAGSEHAGHVRARLAPAVVLAGDARIGCRVPNVLPADLQPGLRVP